jgi:hypothetical protein
MSLSTEFIIAIAIVAAIAVAHFILVIITLVKERKRRHNNNNNNLLSSESGWHFRCHDLDEEARVEPLPLSNISLSPSQSTRTLVPSPADSLAVPPVAIHLPHKPELVAQGEQELLPFSPWL